MDNRLLTFAHLARTVAERVLPERAHKFAPKRYSQPQLLACLLLKEHLGLDYRTAQELLELSDALHTALGLVRVPDHSTLWWFAQHKVSPHLVEQALAETIHFARAVEQPPGPAPPAGEWADAEHEDQSEPSLRCVALDSTGLWTSHASRYYEWRKAQAQRQNRKQRSWQKWAAALWTAPQLVVAQRVRPGPCGDFSDLIPLAGAARAVFPYERLVADAGYDSEANHAFCREQLGVESLIPAKKRRSAQVVARTPYRAAMVRALGCEALGIAGDPKAQRAYGQRWKAETLMSVVKRKWGEALTARKASMQGLQALLRGLVYNLYRLVVLGYRPAFP